MISLPRIEKYLDTYHGSSLTLTREGYGYTATLRDAPGDVVAVGEYHRAHRALQDMETVLEGLGYPE